MQSRPASTFTTPALVSAQLVKAYDGEDETILSEFNTYWTLVQQYCFDMSKLVESQIHCTFVPYFATKTLYFTGSIRNRKFRYDLYSGCYVLELDEDLLAVETLEYMGVELDSDQYRLVDDTGDANGYPYRAIQFPLSEVPSYGLEFTDCISIEGEWGVHDNPDDRFTTVGVTAEALDTTETAIDIADASLYDVYQYARIDDELMLITAATTAGTPDTLTVIRGINGYTAAAHDNGATIRVWNVPHDIRLLTTRMVAYWYNKRSDKGERVQVIDNALVIAQFSKEIAAIAQRRQRSLYGVV